MIIRNEIGLQKVKLPKIELPSVKLQKIFGSGDDSDYEIVAGEPYLTQEGDANNLLLGSGVVYENNLYPLHSYGLYNSSLLNVGTKVTITIWGELGEGKTGWGAYNSGGIAKVAEMTKDSGINGMWTAKALWNMQNSAMNYSLNVYPLPKSQMTVSRVDRVKLELGWNDNPVWTPAPSEVSDDKNSAILLENRGNIILEQDKIRVYARAKR